MNELYYLMKNANKQNNELHIFAGESDKCICKKLNLADTVEIEDSDRIVNESEMRKICAEKGRMVCGTCIASLYGNFID